MAVNPASNEPTVAYRDITNAALKFARLRAGSWQVTTVDDADDTGHDPVLRYDPDRGVVYILYYNQTEQSLMLATRAIGGGVWSITRLLGESRGVRPSLAIEPDGFLRMCFYQESSGNLLTVNSRAFPAVAGAGEAWRRYR